MNTIDWIARVLVIIGALNWGLAIWAADVATWFNVPWLITTIYALVGLAGIWEIVKLFKE